MNLVDFTIAGMIAITALFGLRTGVLAPASGLAGIVVGVVLAFQYHPLLAAELAPLLDDETIRNVASFVGIVLVTTIATKMAASALKSLLSVLGLGWVDHLAGAALGTAVGVVAVGTGVYLLAGSDSAEIQDALARSSLATPIIGASILSAAGPWCAELRHAVDRLDHGDTANPDGCAELKTYANDLVSGFVSDKLSKLLGHDVETLPDVVSASVTGSTQDLADLATDQ